MINLNLTVIFENICSNASQSKTFLIKSRFFLKHLLNLNLNIVLWLGCFVTERPLLELINYMNEPWLNGYYNSSSQSDFGVPDTKFFTVTIQLGILDKW